MVRARFWSNPLSTRISWILSFTLKPSGTICNNEILVKQCSAKIISDQLQYCVGMHKSCNSFLGLYTQLHVWKLRSWSDFFVRSLFLQVHPIHGSWLVVQDSLVQFWLHSILLWVEAESYFSQPGFEHEYFKHTHPTIIQIKSNTFNTWSTLANSWVLTDNLQ